jgi:succinate dehydrogenase/fumarate reductase flavoprotein subunit
MGYGGAQPEDIMTMIESVDVIIIGGGLAGMVAADAACGQGARVLIVDRSTLGMGTNTALSNGVFAGPTAGYNAATYLADTHRIGKEIGCGWMAKRVAADIGEGIEWLRRIGIEMVEKKDHYFVATDLNDPFPGAHLARLVAAYIRQRPGVSFRGGTQVQRLVVEEGRVVGIFGHDHQGKSVAVQAGAVVLATGGAAAIYLRNDNQKSTLGQGYALALNAGLALWDMEFIQYYPIVMAQDRLPAMMLNSPHPEGSRIINAAGEDIAEKYGIADLNDAIRNRRDWLSAVLFEETRNGEVFMDYRAVADRHWERHPLVLLKDRRFDFRNRPVAISPAAHYVMGGVRIDETGQTEVKGLFACGEVVWGLHGACRKGGNALSECLVFGRLAGRHAAWCAKTGYGKAWPDMAPAMRNASGEGDPRALKKEIQALAWRCAGVVRDEDGLAEGLAEIERITRQIQKLPRDTVKDLRAAMDLDGMVRILGCILAASRMRKESRGCFLRNDCPAQNDSQWLKNSCVKTSCANCGGPIVKFLASCVQNNV